MKPAPVLSGLDVLLADPAPLGGRRLGLAANPASVSSGFVPAARALLDAGLDIRVLFGPEHGLTGAVQDMLAVGVGDTPSGRSQTTASRPARCSGRGVRSSKRSP